MHTNTRRGFLELAGAGLLTQSFLRAAQANAQAKYSLPALFDIEKVAEGIFAAIARPAAFINCNAAIFEGAEEIVVVDTHAYPLAAAALVSQLRRDITKKPVRYIVNTHFHGDHVQGTPTFKRIAPHADVVASETTRKALAEDDGRGVKRGVEQAGKALELYKQRAADSKSAEEKVYLTQMISATRSFISEMKDYAPSLPTVTFDRELILRDKAHDLHLAFRGRGHTNGDIVVFCPQKKVIATGDLLQSFLPYMGDGYPREWPVTLDAIGQYEFQTVIGGHGTPQRGRERLGDMRAYIAELAELVGKAKQAGRTLEEIQQAVTPESLSCFKNGYGEFVAGQILKGSFGPPGRTPGSVLTNGVKGNVAQVYANLERS